MNPTVDTAPLSTQDIRALRSATTVTFHHTGEGIGQLRAHLRADDSSTGFDQVRVIDVSSRVITYQHNDPATEPAQAYYYLGYPRTSALWQTILTRLQSGQAVALEWTRGNDTDNYRSVGFHADELRLSVGRSNGRAEHFLIGYQVGPDNSARMITRGSRL
jgi:hypothetical protein